MGAKFTYLVTLLFVHPSIPCHMECMTAGAWLSCILGEKNARLELDVLRFVGQNSTCFFSLGRASTVFSSVQI